MAIDTLKGSRFNMQTHHNSHCSRPFLAKVEKGNGYRSGAKYRTMLIIAPASTPVLNDVLAWFIVPSIEVGRF
jgi:hypothetical protein